MGVKCFPLLDHTTLIFDNSDMKVEDMTAETFTKHVGSIFTIIAGEDRREIHLEKATAKPELMEGAKNPDGSDFYQRAPFTLSFSGPQDELFGQELYQVEHPLLGTMTLFLKPYWEGSGKAYYESIFS